jgi:hypothetical protein
MSDSEAKQFLLNLVARYEQGHGELLSKISNVEIGVIEIKGDIKNMNYRVDELQRKAECNAKNIAELQRNEQADITLRKRVEGLFNNASKIYIPIFIAIMLSAIFGAWEFIKRQIKGN